MKRLRAFADDFSDSMGRAVSSQPYLLPDLVEYVKSNGRVLPAA
jgi:hypothetical protein